MYVMLHNKSYAHCGCLAKRKIQKRKYKKEKKKKEDREQEITLQIAWGVHVHTLYLSPKISLMIAAFKCCRLQQIGEIHANCQCMTDVEFISIPCANKLILSLSYHKHVQITKYRLSILFSMLKLNFRRVQINHGFQENILHYFRWKYVVYTFADVKFIN